MIVSKNIKCLLIIAIAGMLAAVSVGVYAQSADTAGETAVFLPMVAVDGQESHEAFPNGDTPHLNSAEKSAEQMVHAAQLMYEAGDVTSTSFQLQTDIPLESLDPNADWSFSSERKYQNRLLMALYNRYDYLPEAMSFSVSDFDSETPTMFVAATLGKADVKYPVQGGLLVQSKLNPDTNQFEVVADREFSECMELPGVQSSQDGMIIAALCKTPNADNTPRTTFTKDLVTNYGPDNGNPNRTLPNNADRDLWLYEWTNGDITSEPNKFIVHTSVHRNHGLPHSLVFGEEDNTYAISATQQAAGGHTNDSFYIVQRGATPADYKIVTMNQGSNNDGLRGWQNSCANGHPYIISPGFNSTTKEYGVLCTSEANASGVSDMGSINFARAKGVTGETNEKPDFLLMQRDGANRMKGGAGALLPLGDGWIGIVIGTDVELSALDGSGASPATQVGLVQLGQSGNVIAQPDSEPNTTTVGEGLYWVETPTEFADHYVSYPQLVPLDVANGTYLLGYGIMAARGDANSNFGDLLWKLTLPMKYFVQEIEITCADSACTTPASITPLTDAKELDSVGWGMIDQMVQLGVGQVSWATYEMNRMTLPLNAGEGDQPNAFTKKLQFNVYESVAPVDDLDDVLLDTTIQIRARGREGQELMELRVDDQIVSQWIVTQDFELYEYTYPLEVNADQISIYFTNDAPNRPGFDTSLHVDKMILNGITYETEAQSVIGRGHWDGSSCGRVAAHLTQELHCDGYFMYDTAAPTGATIQLRARGREGQELMELRIDDQIVDQWIVTQDFTLYDYAHPTQVNADQISVHFTNDAPNQPGFDPTLHVDRMILNETIYQTEAPSVVGKGYWDGSSCSVEAVHRKQALQCNGYFKYDAAVPTSTTIAVRARGREGQELMELRIDGQIVKQWTVSKKFKDYYYSNPALLTADQVSIHFTNDAPNQPGFDTTLHVDRMILNGARYQTETISVISKGHWDGTSCSVEAAHRTETLHCNGYFLYE